MSLLYKLQYLFGVTPWESSFFDLPDHFQKEYLPLLEHWFVQEHERKVEELRSGFAERS